MANMKMIEDKLVVQANSLIEASYKLKTSQQKFLRIMSSIISKNDEDFKMYEFKINELLEIFQVKDQSKYKEIPKQTRELMGNVLTFKTDKKLIQVPFLNYCEYEIGTGILRVQFHPYLKPFYLYLNKENPYTKYELKNILPLRSVYSIRIYELLKQYEKIGNRTIEIGKLKEMFQIKPNEYTRYNDFKRFVIIQAQKELPLKTDLNFDFIEIKTGRKVTSLKFYIYSNNKKEVKDYIAVTKENKKIYNRKYIEKVKKIMYEHKVTSIEAQKIYDSSNGDIDLISKVYNYFKNKKVENLVGTMISMVKPGAFQEPISNTPKTHFNDYDQREYDYNELEKKLLGWDKEEIDSSGEKFEQSKLEVL